MDFVGDWFGGKPGGSVSRHNLGWIVRFQNPYASKCFADSAHGGQDGAQEAAKQWKEGESLRRGQTRNLMRVARQSGETYLEVQLQDGQVMKCDLDDSAVATSRVWCSWRSSPASANYYAYHTGRKGEPAERFHRVLCPQWAVVDHVNRDGLDNRRANLRDGGDGVNARNMGKRVDNVSGVTGVSYNASAKAWVVQWSEAGCRHSKRFPGKENDEGPKGRAIEFRRRAAERCNNLNGVPPATAAPATAAPATTATTTELAPVAGPESDDQYGCDPKKGYSWTREYIDRGFNGY